MKNTKRMISAAMALVLCLMLMPAGIVSAAEVQTGGYENGNGLDLNRSVPIFPVFPTPTAVLPRLYPTMR